MPKCSHSKCSRNACEQYTFPDLCWFCIAIVNPCGCCSETNLKPE